MTWLEDLVGSLTDREETNKIVVVGMEEILFELQSLCSTIENHVINKAKLSTLDAEIGILKMAVHSSGRVSGTHALVFKIEVPKPKPFYGGRNAK